MESVAALSGGHPISSSYSIQWRIARGTASTGHFVETCLDAGRIVEHGTHDELLRQGGHYERLWRHQSGGFQAPESVTFETETDTLEEPPADELRPESKPEPKPEPTTDHAPVVSRT